MAQHTISFSEHPSISVEVAQSGEEAVERCRRDAPDLIVLDPLHPGKGGGRLFDRLREDAGTRFIHMIFLGAEEVETAGAPAADLRPRVLAQLGIEERPGTREPERRGPGARPGGPAVAG